MIPDGINWSGFDVMLSSLDALRRMAVNLGARATEHFFPGYPTKFNERITEIHTLYDVVFIGQWNLALHANRNRYLHELAKAASNSDAPFSLGLYLSGGVDTLTPEVAAYNLGSRYGTEMHKALRSGRIAIDARGILFTKNTADGKYIDLAGKQTANMRIFEATGCGVFLLAEYHDNLKDYFELGTEIETFRDDKELIKKIHYYLAHPEEREAIARRGQARCLRDYSMERRATEMDRIIRKHLALKEAQNQLGQISKNSNSPKDLREKASLLIHKGEYQQAFSLLCQAKAQYQPEEGIDYLRAHCFIRMSQHLAAREALKEELRFFPGNNDAVQLLDNLERVLHDAQSSQLTLGVEDEEFLQLLKIIQPYTMVSEKRLYSLFTLAKKICTQNIPGNFAECGVAAGGSSALLAYVIKHYSNIPRRLFAFDSFAGMPEPTVADTTFGKPAQATGWGAGTCAAPETSVQEVCAKVDALEILITVKGFFEKTLPQWQDRVGMLALLHLDGDWYESTKTILSYFYDRVINDGILQLDDYGHWEGCKKSIHEFETDRGLKFDIKPIDYSGIWFVKPDHFPVNQNVLQPLIEGFNEIETSIAGIEIKMSPNERFQLFYILKKLLPQRSTPLRFIAIGSFSGGSLARIYLSLKSVVHSIQGICIEPMGGLPIIVETHKNALRAFHATSRLSFCHPRSKHPCRLL